MSGNKPITPINGNGNGKNKFITPKQLENPDRTFSLNLPNSSIVYLKSRKSSNYSDDMKLRCN